MKTLEYQMEKLESSSAKVPSELKAKMDAVTEEWRNVQRNAERRDKAIRAVSSQADQ